MNDIADSIIILLVNSFNGGPKRCNVHMVFVRKHTSSKGLKRVCVDQQRGRIILKLRKSKTHLAKFD